jgi:UV DNA damage endonuclease
MKIGYPCINWTIGCKSNKTFRLKSYTEERLKTTVKNNLECLEKILKYNIKKNILFFRITSDLIPFASHPICTFNWQDFFKKDFLRIGELIQKNDIRISMHPDQFIVLNSPNRNIVERSKKELLYHAEILDLMNLNFTAKIQLHVGGAYNNKKNSIYRFIKHYKELEPIIKKRLVIENDDRIYTLKDCLYINQGTGIPVLFDIFHHSILNNGETTKNAVEICTRFWGKKDGLLMLDYSSKKVGGSIRSHADTIDISEFKLFLKITKPYDFDIMLEIKDKEKSALKAIKILEKDKRFLKIK